MQIWLHPMSGTRMSSHVVGHRRARAGTVRMMARFLTVAAFVAACSSGPSRGPVALFEATLVDPTTIAFGVPSCNGEPAVARLEETSTQVRVEVVSTVHPNGDSCADSIQVELESPLGDRDVIDLGGGGRMNVSTR